MRVLRSRFLPVLLGLALTTTVAVSGRVSWAEARSSGSSALPKPVAPHDADVEPVKPVAAPSESPDLKRAVDKTIAAANKPVTWPAPAHRSVVVQPAGTRADGPVTARALKGGTTATVDVEFLDQAASARAGVSGVLVKATAPTSRSDVQLSFDYSGFANAFGADWAARLTVVALPACILTTPNVPACSTSTPLQAHNDTSRETVSATTPVTAQPSVFALTAASDSSTGDYAATQLSAASSWSGGGASGDFTWSYPLRMPPAAAGPTPSLAFQYSAQSIDGRTSATNNQVSWVGEGFDLTESYIERKYTSCDEDGNAGKYDQCWKYDNATLTLNGKSNELVRATGDVTGASTWKLKNDDGSRVEKLVGTVDNGDARKEYWRVTTTDGTQYYFGKHQLNSSMTTYTNSVYTVPVAGDDAAEPCHASTFATSFCNLGWRWNLDYVVDLHGNAMSYWYTKETNNYAKNGVASPGTPYVRGGYLNRIDYGLRDSTLATAKAPQQVVFTTAERCLANCSVLSSTTKANWPDVPFDQVCEGSTACTNKVSPTFFSRERLYQIQTQVLNGTTYQPVDFWQTNLTFPSTNDGSTGAPMWLAGISHSGKAGTALSVPNVIFSPIGMANRVDSGTDGLNGLVRYRIHDITTETGAKVMVNYAGPECMSGERPAKDSNTKRCYPVKWTPPREVEREDWFHKYVLDNVVTSDPTGNGALMMTQYLYSGGAAWHYQESPMLKDNDKTWSDWRGYGTVTTYTGDPTDPAPRSRSVTKYFRGMDGDKLEGTTAVKNVDVADTTGTLRADLAPLSGSPREQITYQNENSNTEVSGVITDYVVTQKAVQAVPGGTLQSNFVGASATQSRVHRDGGRPDLIRSVATTYDPDNGLANKVTDYGDATKVDETCTITAYAKKTVPWLVALPMRIVTSTGACDAASANPPENRVLSDVRTFYDGLTYGDASKGDATTVQRVHHYTNGLPIYQTTGTKAYDALGRATSTGDALGRITTTDYTPAATGPLTQTVVKQPTVNTYSGTPANFATTTTYRPEWGLPSKTVDPNGKVTEMAYDALGRLTAVWLPSQAPASTMLANTKYTYTLSQTAASTVRTDQLNVEANGYVTSYAQFDSLLRPRQTQAPGANGGRVITESRYDSRGQVTYANQDIWDSGAPAAALVNVANASVPNQTYNEYDGTGRVVKSTFMSMLQPKWSTTTVYGGDTTTVLPPAGGSATSTVTDVRGQVIERREYDGNAATGTPDVTTYTFDLDGRMTRMQGAGGVWTYTYDLRGRKIQSTDPDSGTTTSTFDEGDRLVSTTDSTNNTLVTTYDALDRKTALYKSSVDPANLLADWMYDKTGLLGQLAMSTSYTAGKTGPAYRMIVNSRNVLYKPTQITRDIPSVEGVEIDGSYWTNYAYKPDAKTPALISYSGGGGLGADDVQFDYSPLGLPTRMYSTRGTYVNDVDYNQFGDVTLYDLGSNADMFIANIYEDGTRRLSRSSAGDVQVVSDHQYTYDPVGNVTKDQNLVDGGDTQCFGYDGHTRLTSAWTPGDKDCTKAPSTTALGGVAPYWQSWTYTPTGLRQTQTDHSASGDVTSTYTYNTDQPHTLAKVTGAGAEKDYQYDARGNTTVRPGQTLNWDAQGKLSKLTSSAGDTNYVYDADGNLLVRRGPTETTLFLGELELTLNKATRQVLGKRQYEFNGQTIAVRSANGTATSDFSWLVTDYHETSQVAVDAATLTATKRYAKPFGDPRGVAPGAWPDNHGFLGKPEDKDTGLTTVGAREYDPTIGRFLSVDPVLDIADPQQMLGYTYANDNPTSGSDPTGLKNAADGDGGGGYTDDDVDTLYPVAGAVNDNPHPHRADDDGGTNNDDGNGGGGNHDGGGHHKKSGIGGWLKKRVNDAKDKVDEAHDWAKAHASEIGEAVAIGVAVVGVAAFCGATAGIGCLVVAGAVAGAAGAGLGYGAQVALDDNLSFSTASLAKEVAIGGVSGAVGGAGGKLVGAVGKTLLAKVASGAGAEAGEAVANTAARACSFSGTTTVLMADGSQKQIQDVRIGDEVVATDPETGEQLAEPVEHVFVHGDVVTDLVVEGDVVTTTEDHPFWSVTDQAFERADQLGSGEQVLGADGRVLTVSGLKKGTERQALAYNLSVRGIHTYHVGDRAVLVHNTCNRGIYIVNSKAGVYVGQSKNISKRLAQHVRDGKFTQAEADNAARQGVVGNKTSREIAEQMMIDRLGGINNLRNVVNPIGPKRFPLMPNQPYSR
ncbi:RHS repeat-associated core domain-containing protein [Kribbella jejuensis]|uniref:RHS repeat-associated protein n=1 Tax=Kribbella jejuensis TaxID=236068 RepID=A0A542E943_9ACTN|nr:RHS repeat-associated core domain-containing protein [Kribbella jejuensis]TQJ11834.1 RHS repeat-associated protein [Kribbella jejuensis]